MPTKKQTCNENKMLSHALGHDHETKFGAYRSMIKAVKFPETPVIKLILFRRYQGNILGIEQAAVFCLNR